MGFQDVKAVWKVGIIFYVIALIAYIVGFATPEWYTVNGSGFFGLFRVCNIYECFDIDDRLALPNGINKSNLWTPSQAVLGTGIALLVIGGILVVAATAINNGLLSLPGVFLIIIGGIFGLAGGIFFMVKGTEAVDKVVSYGVGYSSIILLLASIAEIISAFLLLAGRPSHSSIGP
ncbi:hypothetical protein BsWGS_07612 [Bradybaena similaris]